MSDVNLKISNELIQSIVEKKVQAEVASALSESQEQIINNLVKNALGKPLKYDGTPSRYRNEDYFNNQIEYEIHNAMKKMSAEIVFEWIEKSKEKLQKQIETEMTKKAKTLSTALINNFINGQKDSIKYDLVVSTPIDTQRNVSVGKRLEAIERKLKETSSL